jgi:hypothetical protein
MKNILYEQSKFTSISTAMRAVNGTVDGGHAVMKPEIGLRFANRSSMNFITYLWHCHADGLQATNYEERHGKKVREEPFNQ